MYILVKETHSIVAFIALLVLSAAFLYSVYSWVSKKEFTATNKLLALAGLITVHLQLVCGILIYFLSPLGFSSFSGEAMKNRVSRLYILEHPLMMIIGIVLITIGYSQSKRIKDDMAKYKKIVLFYGIGLFLIMMRIPWDAWF